MTGQADSEQFVNMAAAGSPRTSRPMESPWAWPDLNVGYKNGWTGSPVLRPRSWICSRHTTKSLRGLFGAEGIPDPYGGAGATGSGSRSRDFAVWHFEDGQVAEISTIQDQFALLKQIGYLPDEVRAA
jgi:hypothetical protein